MGARPKNLLADKVPQLLGCHLVANTVVNLPEYGLTLVKSFILDALEDLAL